MTIAYDYINEYIRKTIRKNEGLLLEMEQYAEENHVPIAQPEVAKLLEVMGKMNQPSRVLEVGTAIGYSAILLAGTLKPGGKLDTIDRYEMMIEKAKENIARAGLQDTITILEGDAAEILPKLDNTYDMVFLDAAKGHYLDFLPHCLKVLRKGGLLISDNVLYKGMIANKELVIRRKITIVKRMRKYLDYICNTDELETSLLPLGDGVALSLKLK